MKKHTLTIGIPACNEEQNIIQLLDSIYRQEQKIYQLKQVLIINDGSTDRTKELIIAYQKKRPSTRLVTRTKRSGKASALNMIYDKFTSDYLLTIDADLVIKNTNAVENMMRKITKQRSLNLVGARHIPVMPETFMGKCAYYSYISFEDAFLKLNNGNNFYAMMAVALMPKAFVKTVRYPKGTISDQCYLYAFATRKSKNAFMLIKSAEVYFRPVSTFADWRILGVRSVIGDKADVSKHFGKHILDEYYMPRTIYMKSLIKWFIKSPLYMAGSVLLNIYIRKFPYNKVAPKNGMWALAQSSKVGIIT